MYPELQLLGRFTYSVASKGNLAANTAWSPAPTLATPPGLAQGYLNGTQAGEVKRMVVYPPVNPTTGASDDLKYVQLTLDGVDYPYIYMSGRQESNMAPAPNRVRFGSVIDFGKPIFSDGGVALPLDATCPKFVTSATIKAWAGSSAVSHDFTVEIWGYLYNSTWLAGAMPQYPAVAQGAAAGQAFGQTITTAGDNAKSFTAVVMPILAGADWRGGWLGLPGGPAQGAGGAMPINKLIRTATNANATTKSQGYIPQYANSSSSPAVANPWDNLYFNLNPRQALIIQRYGVNGPAAPNSTGYDLLTAWIARPSAGGTQESPPYGIPADYNLGETHFGLAKGETNKFDGVPYLPQGETLITSEIAWASYVDNGTSIPAGDVRQAFVATLVGVNAQGVQS